MARLFSACCDRWHCKMKRKSILLVLGIAAALGIVIAMVEYNWSMKRAIAPSGGRYFFHRVELPVPQFFQADENWARDSLGPTEGTLGAEGCAISSVAMVFKF